MAAETDRLSPIVGTNGQPIIVRQVVEAAGATVIDDDEGEWRRLSGAADRDLSPLTQDRMQRLAIYQWERNLLANRLIELPVAYLLAEGVSVAVEDADAQAIVNRMWRDPINDMDASVDALARELLLFGELALPVFTNPANGQIRIASIDPADIETVVTDPDNRRIVIGLVLRRDRKGEGRRFRVIHQGPEADLFTERTQAIRATFTDGECLYTSINRLTHGSRGRSHLLAQIDWLDAYDQFLFGELDRVGFLRAFVWDVTLSGATEEQVKTRARQITPPRPGSVRVHNDAEVWNAVSPQLGAGDTGEHARLFRNHILGGATYPEHWYGGAEDVNRSTGESMSEPTYKVMSQFQRRFGLFLEQLARLAINRAFSPSGEDFAIDPYDPDPLLVPSVQWPELTTKDTTRYAAALSQTVVGAAAAVERGLLTEATAVRLIASLAAKLGVEIDATSELRDARVERDARRRREREDLGYTDRPDLVPDAGDEGEPPAPGEMPARGA